MTTKRPGSVLALSAAFAAPRIASSSIVDLGPASVQVYVTAPGCQNSAFSIPTWLTATEFCSDPTYPSSAQAIGHGVTGDSSLDFLGKRSRKKLKVLEVTRPACVREDATVVLGKDQKGKAI